MANVLRSAIVGMKSILMWNKALTSLVFTALFIFVPLEFLIDYPINGAIAGAEAIYNAFQELKEGGIVALAKFATLPLAVLDAGMHGIYGLINNNIIKTLNGIIPGYQNDIAYWNWQNIHTKVQYKSEYVKVKFDRVNLVPQTSIFSLLIITIFGVHPSEIWYQFFPRG